MKTKENYSKKCECLDCNFGNTKCSLNDPRYINYTPKCDPNIHCLQWSQFNGNYNTLELHSIRYFCSQNALCIL